ncbi:MAG: DUF3822 family protein [Bacteroidales bacterium]|nr:DUF3822 family protein [Bacteroidales bacterium]
MQPSGWLEPGSIFTTPELQKRYDEVEISLFTPKCTLVPEAFFDPASVRDTLAAVVPLRSTDAVASVSVPEAGAVLLYSNSMDESLSRVISQTVLTTAGESVPVYPELYYILKELPLCPEYNKILASYRDGTLHLAVAQGRTLQLANVYRAVDFTTAEYFIFLALKTLQVNPEISTICWRTPLEPSEEMSLYRYFKAVEVL